jgi:DNA topoisomerase-3
VKNYTFTYQFAPPWGNCHVTFTSVSGHIINHDFPNQFRKWEGCDPGALFDAPIERSVDDKNKPIAENIKREARNASGLFIWTDCDREGENIGAEIRELAQQSNSRLEIKRAHFSNIERAHIIQAAQNPVALDDRQANAVDARIEIDLRTGAAFTRALTLNLRPMIQPIEPDLKVISYGKCANI